jgi:hypothetical protein
VIARSWKDRTLTQELKPRVFQTFFGMTHFVP